MNHNKILLIVFGSIAFNLNSTQNQPFDLCMQHRERLHSVAAHLQHTTLMNEDGTYNEEGKFVHANLKQLKTDSDLQQNSAKKSCDACPNYGLPENYIEHLKAHKHKLNENDQQMIESLSPFLSHQECMLLVHKKMLEEKTIHHKYEDSSNSWWNTIFKISLGAFGMYFYLKRTDH